MSNYLISKILFIDENYVKKYSSVMQNVDEIFIKSHIAEAQSIHIHQVLGGWLYEDILDEYEDNNNSGTTISTKYTTLVNDYIKPCLLYYTLYESVYDLYLKITNKGLQVQKSDYSDPISEELLEKYKVSYKNKAEFYSERMLNYLRNNENTYVKWRDTNPNNPYQILPEKDNTYDNGGMFILNRNNKTSSCYSRRNLRRI